MPFLKKHMTTLKKLAINDFFEVEFENQGSAGLKLLFKDDNEGVVSVQKLDMDEKILKTIRPGDPITVKFKIEARTKGRTHLIFYQTRVWDKNFKIIVLEEFLIEVF